MHRATGPKWLIRKLGNKKKIDAPRQVPDIPVWGKRQWPIRPTLSHTEASQATCTLGARGYCFRGTSRASSAKSRKKLPLVKRTSNLTSSPNRFFRITRRVFWQPTIRPTWGSEKFRLRQRDGVFRNTEKKSQPIFAQMGRDVERGGRSFPCSALVCLKKGFWQWQMMFTLQKWVQMNYTYHRQREDGEKGQDNVIQIRKLRKRSLPKTAIIMAAHCAATSYNK